MDHQASRSINISRKVSLSMDCITMVMVSIMVMPTPTAMVITMDMSTDILTRIMNLGISELR